MIDKMQDVNVRLEYKENGYIENILYNYYYLLDKLQFLQEEHKRISDKLNASIIVIQYIFNIAYHRAIHISAFIIYV